jgi:N-acetylglutamate synthase-like GNAT family acetyltransferase
MVAEDVDPKYKDSKKSSSIIAGVSHAYVCPSRNVVWLEGVRVRRNYRRISIASQLIKKMVEYGKEKGAKEAAAVVSINNIASQSMMEKNGFIVTSKWNYYSTEKLLQKFETEKAKIATSKDTERIRNYLKKSPIFKSSAESYVDSWRWYHLDLHSDILHSLIKKEKVFVMGNDVSIVDGVAIIGEGNNIFQIGYLDAFDGFALKCLAKSVLDLAYNYEIERHGRIQIFCPQTLCLQALIEDLGIFESGQFLLYKRNINK